MNIIELEQSVSVHHGPCGVRCIEIASIPEPWQSEFMRWLCAGALRGDERIHQCHASFWRDWLHHAPANTPELSPSSVEEYPFTWFDLREAMRMGYRQAFHHRRGKFVRYPDDLDREIRYQVARSFPYEKTLQQAYIQGFCRGLAKKPL